MVPKNAIYGQDLHGLQTGISIKNKIKKVPLKLKKEDLSVQFARIEESTWHEKVILAYPTRFSFGYFCLIRGGIRQLPA